MPKAIFSADFESARKEMVENQIKRRGIQDAAVLQALLKVPRHLFVEPEDLSRAYSDFALPIKENQTISQPYIVALMTQSAMLKADDHVLEIGTGSAYQAAVLAEIVKEVYSIEIVESLARTAASRLKELGYNNVTVRHGDGYRGWQKKSPFDAILITAATPKIPRPLLDQLKVGGRMVLPLGQTGSSQELMVLTKQEDGSLKEKFITGVVFVPMTGEIRQ
ncbi:MAG: protein-L-isoaspartate(D-aspartate) O-methyltransferase [Nitrospinae bacterium]|nr:protein-L-isoaspartate(D-aspartate) O-methyltransferase [Nitrospinota bacterium]MBL7021282.1 protein-L-isoaspartate(D-aspartate) O-methyltransferase [Nitrospinaceae bacterium]